MDDDDLPSLGDMFAQGLGRDLFSMSGFGPTPQGLFSAGSVGAVPFRHPPVDENAEMMKAYKGLWEMVPTSWLRNLPGNQLRGPVDELAADIQANGLKSPLILNAGKNSRTAQLGEGNHRLAAIEKLGFTHAPARTIVGSEWGRGRGRNMDMDLIPQPDTYFRADAAPSDVFRSLLRLRGGR